MDAIEHLKEDLELFYDMKKIALFILSGIDELIERDTETLVSVPVEITEEHKEEDREDFFEIMGACDSLSEMSEKGLTKD